MPSMIFNQRPQLEAKHMDPLVYAWLIDDSLAEPGHFTDPAIHISGKVPQQMGVVDGERTPERFDHNGTLMDFQYSAIHLAFS